MANLTLRHREANRSALSGSTSRRTFLRLGALGTGLLLVGTACSTSNIKGMLGQNAQEGSGDKTTPNEDLAQEHGVLNRVLLIYEEAVRRIESQQDLDPGVVGNAAGIVHTFVNGYHELLEESYLFPRFRQAGKLADLVSVLTAQHQAGRNVNGTIQQLATRDALNAADQRRTLVESIWSFVRMYRPHAAREDTVLFPAFRQLMTDQEYDALGNEFEDRERQLVGENGFEGVVSQIMGLETKLGIADLSQFTPSI